MNNDSNTPVLILFGIALLVLSGIHFLHAANAVTPSECPAIRPYLVDCQRCAKVKLRDTGNSTSGGGRIVSERTRCKRCSIEFREDLACQPVPIPQPGL